MGQENPSAFKLIINDQLIDIFAKGLTDLNLSKNTVNDFKATKKEIGPLELKDRIKLISTKLYAILGDDLLEAYLKVFLKNATYHESISGLKWWPISDLVEIYSLKNLEKSFEYFLLLTEVFTSEFAVRSVLNNQHPKVIDFLIKSSKSDNHHHRRFASEGSRPLLPWGKKAIIVAKDPKLTAPILEQLKYDTELYVRKSVANHLNDFSKLDPSFVLNLLKKWKKEAPEQHKKNIDWITRHALRTLVKKGDKTALELINGKMSRELKVLNIKDLKKLYKVGETILIEFSLKNPSKTIESYTIDYIIGYVLKTGKIGYKTYKGLSGKIGPSETIVLQKKHFLRVVTTRTFYKGKHEIGLIVNGETLPFVDFKFLV